MSVEVYVGRKFKHEHEREALRCFLQDMLPSDESEDELYIIIVEAQVSTAAPDLLLISRHALVIADLKELTRAYDQDPGQVKLSGKENGPWTYLLPNGGKYTLGGSSKTSNPYQQLQDMRYALANWIKDHSQDLPGGPWEKKRALKYISAWVALSRGFDGDTEQLDLPWPQIKPWFKVVSLKNLAREFLLETASGLELSADDMRSLAAQLGVTKRDLSEFVNTPPSPPPFFSPPPVARSIIGREQERSELQGLLSDSKVPIISLDGPGGVGKTTLAAWLVGEMRRSSYKVRWVECTERDVTGETLLAAIAAEVPERQQAAVICDQEQRMLDRLDAALDFLDKEPALLVFKDYHVVHHSSLEAFMSRVVNRAENLRIVLTTRERLACLDNPGWPLGVVRRVQLGGIPLEALPDFFSAAGNPVKLAADQLDKIWKRTSGNPYALKMLSTMLRGRESELDTIPLETEELFHLLLGTVSKDARSLAYRLSVVRTKLDEQLIAHLYRGAREVALELTHELVDKYCLQETGQTGRFTMYELARESLYNKMQPGPKRVAHCDAGSYFAKLADVTQQEDRMEYLVETLYHFERGQNEQTVLQRSPEAYVLLVGHGDWDRAQIVANRALAAARAKKDQEQTSFWLLQIAERDITQGRMTAANQNLEEALTQLPRPGKKTSAEQKKQWRGLEMHIWMQKGRLAYRRADYALASECLAKGISLAQEIDDRHARAQCLVQIGRIERQQGQYSQAQLHFDEARDLANELQDMRLVGECISHLGLIARKRGEYERAGQCFREALEIGKKAGNWISVEINYGHLGSLVFQAGDFNLAEKIFRECLGVAEKNKNGLGVRINLGRLAEVLIKLGKYSEAENLLDKAERLNKDVGDEVGIAWNLKRQGQLAQAKGDIERGNGLVLQGIQKLREIGNEEYIQDFQRALVN